jgi:PAT family beta-lactamase induction signal transducer AmpG
MAQAMTIPYYLSLGFSNTEIGAVAKIFGTAALLAGVFVGGGLALKLGLTRALLVIGILQGVSTAGFAALAYVGKDLGWLAGVIAFENLAGGMGAAALIAFMAALTNRQFTATQFALLSALATLPRVVLVAPSGLFASVLGWPSFFVGCSLLAVPGLLLLIWMRRSFDLSIAPSPAGPAAHVGPSG